MTASPGGDAVSGRFHLVAWLLLARRDGRVLLARREGVSYGAGLWGLPGGHVEDGEPMALAAAREAAEEVGVTVAVHDLTALGMNRWSENGEHGVSVFFAAGAWTGRPEPLSECSEVGWFDPAALPDDCLDWLPGQLGALSQPGWFSEILEDGSDPAA